MLGHTCLYKVENVLARAAFYIARLEIAWITVLNIMAEWLMYEHYDDVAHTDTQYFGTNGRANGVRLKISLSMRYPCHVWSWFCMSQPVKYLNMYVAHTHYMEVWRWNIQYETCMNSVSTYYRLNHTQHWFRVRPKYNMWI